MRRFVRLSMTAPTNHTVTITNRFANIITAPVVYVQDMGSGKAEVRIESNFFIDIGYDYPATYSTGSHEAKGHYRVSAKSFTATQTYIYMGIFTRE